MSACCTHSVLNRINTYFLSVILAKKCLIMVQDWLGTCQTQIWLPRMLKFLSNSKIPQFQRRVISAALCALAYAVWWARNEAIQNLIVWKLEVVVRRMRSLLIMRINLVLAKEITVNDKICFEKYKNAIVQFPLLAFGSFLSHVVELRLYMCFWCFILFFSYVANKTKKKTS